MANVVKPISWVLRAEGFVVFAFALGAYSKQEFSWITFTIFFLLPDLSFAGYLFSTKIGAFTYNMAHSYIGALCCLAFGYFLKTEWALLVGLIWCAHIGFDRTLGYGLKYSKGFGYTHLGRIGKARSN